MPLPETLKAAVVGVGHLGRHHARIYSQMPGIELSGVVDIHDGAFKNLELGPGKVSFHHSIESLLRSRIDLVSIATPTSTHRPVAIPFLRRQIPVLLEKPIAATQADAQVLVEEADATKTILQIGHVEEFNPALEACRHLIEKPRFIEAHRLGAFSGRSLDVDVVADLMIHDLDFVLHWMGEKPNLVHAIGIPVLSSRIDMASVRLEFPGGSIANLTASRVSLRPQRRFRLFMKNRYVRIDFLERSVECAERRQNNEGVPEIKPVCLEVQEGEPLKREIESFVDTVRKKAAPRVNGRRALAALSLASEIDGLISARIHRWDENENGTRG